MLGSCTRVINYTWFFTNHFPLEGLILLFFCFLHPMDSYSDGVLIDHLRIKQIHITMEDGLGRNQKLEKYPRGRCCWDRFFVYGMLFGRLFAWVAMGDGWGFEDGR